jgi:hypothetical protein
MNACDAIRRRLKALAQGGPVSEDEAPMTQHLEECPECRRSRDEIQRILDGAGAVRGDIESAMASIDWEALPERIADAAFTGKARPADARKTRSFWAALVQPRFRPVYAGLVAGIVLGSVGMLVVLKSRPGALRAARPYVVTREFIDQAEFQLAKKETLDYLDKSQYLLLDFVQSPPGKSLPATGAPEPQRIRDLLSMKRYINPQLGTVRMAKAREICDQIDLLFRELAMISEGLSPTETAPIKDFIEQTQLLLKIKILKKELQDNEV